eukprot:4330074-Lingulodinium_polyedra.AAC.1
MHRARVFLRSLEPQAQVLLRAGAFVCRAAFGRQQRAYRRVPREGLGRRQLLHGEPAALSPEPEQRRAPGPDG